MCYCGRSFYKLLKNIYSKENTSLDRLSFVFLSLNEETFPLYNISEIVFTAMKVTEKMLMSSISTEIH